MARHKKVKLKEFGTVQELVDRLLEFGGDNMVCVEYDSSYRRINLDQIEILDVGKNRERAVVI